VARVRHVELPAAAAGAPAVVALAEAYKRRGGFLVGKTGLHGRLDAILDSVTDDPFVREWWAAAAGRNTAALTRLLARPEVARMSSRELSSLADGLADHSFGNREALGTLLREAYVRFPGEFWVNFRLGTTERSKLSRSQRVRHLSAAIAARPRSATARVMLASELREETKNDPSVGRLLRGAAEADPTSAWPHFMLGRFAREDGTWPEVTAAFRDAVRADPDVGFFMVAVNLLDDRLSFPWPVEEGPTDAEIEEFLSALIVLSPDHPGGYQLRGEYLYNVKHDCRGALADARKARSLMSPDYPLRPMLETQLADLEHLSRWEAMLPEVLRGEWSVSGRACAELAMYCSGFERKYALAADFAGRAMTSPDFDRDWTRIIQFAGWAVRAGLGQGADGAALSPDERARHRKQALEWLRGVLRTAKRPSASNYARAIRANPDLPTIGEPAELAKLPPEERAEWQTFWAGLAVPKPKPKPGPPEPAPPPRGKMS
jgi:hypothetical protein